MPDNLFNDSNIAIIATAIRKCTECQKIYSHQLKLDFPNNWENLLENRHCVSCLEKDEDLSKCYKCGRYDSYDNYGYHCSGCDEFFCADEKVYENPGNQYESIERYC